MNTFSRLLLLGLTALLGACASVAGGNVQKIYVQTQAADGATVNGADCALSNDKGTWRLKSPGDTSVVRSNRPMEVKCEKPPLPQGVLSVESGTRGAMLVDDVDAIPYISDRGRESYRDWLGRPTPRAFALSAEGHWAATWTLNPTDASHPRDPSERALMICQQRSKGVPCKLYAINGAVVWTKEARSD